MENYSYSRKLINLLIIFLLLLTNSCYQNKEDIKSNVLNLAEEWLNSWNGTVDPEKMMATYHHDMKYVWRGVSPPGTYESSRIAAQSMPALGTNYQLIMSNLDITVIDQNNAIVFFHFDDKNGSPYGKGAASLVMTKRDNEWKIIYVHESTIENHG